MDQKYVTMTMTVSDKKNTWALALETGGTKAYDKRTPRPRQVRPEMQVDL